MWKSSNGEDMALGFTSYIVENDQRLASAFDRAIKQVDDLRIPFKQVAKDFRKSRKAIFKLKGPGGYPDLSERYKKVKKNKYGFVYPILRASGRLEKSITESSSPDHLEFIGKKSLKIGTSVPYGIYHQSDRPRAKMPLRKFLFVGPESTAFAGNKQLSGFPQRALNTINSFVLRKMRASIYGATGVRPRIKE